MPDNDYIKRSDAVRCKYTFEQGNGVEIEPIEAVPVSYLQKIPAADVEPVRRGHWVYKMRELIRYEDVTGTDPLGGVQTVTVKTHIRGPVPYCSLCDALAADSFLDYCPRCGAKMDKEEEDA